MSRTPFLILNFLDFDVYVVMTPTFPEEMCQFFENVAILSLWSKRAIFVPNNFDRQSALQTSQKDKNDRIPFTLTFHPHNHAVKSIILNNFKLLQNDPETGRIFSQPPLITFTEAHSKLTSNPALSNACAHYAKIVLSLLTLANYRNLSDLLRSPIVSHVPPQMLFIA